MGHVRERGLLDAVERDSDHMEMHEAAESYCQVIEAARGSDRATFVRDVARSLSSAIAAGYELLALEIAEESLEETAMEPIPNDRWLACLADITSVLGVWDDYWTTHEVYRVIDADGLPDLTSAPPGDFAVNLSLADALADIWRDLRAGLTALGEGVAPDDVAWEWQLGFRTHWGAHAVEALRAIHAQLTI
jgi:hypothetical protein